MKARPSLAVAVMFVCQFPARGAWQPTITGRGRGCTFCRPATGPVGRGLSLLRGGAPTRACSQDQEHCIQGCQNVGAFAQRFSGDPDAAQQSESSLLVSDNSILDGGDVSSLLSDESMGDGDLVFRDPQAQLEWERFAREGVSPAPLQARSRERVCRGEASSRQKRTDADAETSRRTRPGARDSNDSLLAVAGGCKKAHGHIRPRRDTINGPGVRGGLGEACVLEGVVTAGKPGVAAKRRESSLAYRGGEASRASPPRGSSEASQTRGPDVREDGSKRKAASLLDRKGERGSPAARIAPQAWASWLSKAESHSVQPAGAGAHNTSRNRAMGIRGGGISGGGGGSARGGEASSTCTAAMRVMGIRGGEGASAVSAAAAAAAPSPDTAVAATLFRPHVPGAYLHAALAGREEAICRLQLQRLRGGAGGGGKTRIEGQSRKGQWMGLKRSADGGGVVFEDALAKRRRRPSEEVCM